MKIKHAEHNLKKILENEQKLSDEYYFEVSDFLTAVRSIFDHLLDDYDSKYKLNIPSDTFNLKNKFCESVKGNPEAEKFYHWYDKESQKIIQDPEFGFLLKKRNISIHRKNLKSDKMTLSGKGFEIKAEPHQAVNVAIDIFSQKPKAVQTTTDLFTGEKVQQGIDLEIKMGVFFDENPNKTVDRLCTLLLDRIKKFVVDTTSNY